MKPNRAVGLIVALIVVIGYYRAGGNTTGYALAVEQPSPPASSEETNTPPPTPVQEQPEVLSSGPVHEAFAGPVNLQVQAGLVAPAQPPANIEEIPPADRPAGRGFVWVPGYWAWDGDRNTYIWVSACWRVAPPNMNWVPGYWYPVADGWEWVAGFWAPGGVRQIEYLPAPPEPDAVEPPGLPPSPDYVWQPACWYWYQGQYIRRPGYWLAVHAGWVWAPSHYVWTPRGYVFVPGHWDYSLERRGVLFAPVYFPRSVYLRAGFIYSPSIVVDVGLLTLNLFTYPRYCHYYFGDYYDDVYIRIGIYAWFDRVHIHRWCDPIYEYDRCRFRRTDPRWEERLHNDYDLRRRDRDLRPSRTYREMESRLTRLPESQRENVRLVQPLSSVTAGRTTTMKFERINIDTRHKIGAGGAEVQKFRDQRNRWESPGAGLETGAPPRERTEPVAPPGGRTEPVRPPTERTEPVRPPTERKEPVTPPGGRTEPVKPPTERKEPGSPPSERTAPVTPRGEIEQPVTPRDRTEPGSPPAERTTPATRRGERIEPGTPAEAAAGSSVDRAPEIVPPRKVPVGRPERVKIPASPVVGKPSSNGKPPARPTDEQESKGEDTRKDDRERNSK